MVPVGRNPPCPVLRWGLFHNKRRGHCEVCGSMSLWSWGPQQLNSYYNVKDCALGYCTDTVPGCMQGSNLIGAIKSWQEIENALNQFFFPKYSTPVSIFRVWGDLSLSLSLRWQWNFSFFVIVCMSCLFCWLKRFFGLVYLCVCVCVGEWKCVCLAT